VLAHNKTLAAQLYGEFKELFPHNAVEYFVSYYDYYQPEAYVPSTDTYIEKDSSINEEIDRLRHSATRSLLERRDVFIVASVSCIYGLGSAEAYYDQLVFARGRAAGRPRGHHRQTGGDSVQRNDVDFHRGTFRVRGDVVEVFPMHEDSKAVRIEFFGDEVEAITEIDPLRGQKLARLDRVAIYPGSHYVVGDTHRLDVPSNRSARSCGRASRAQCRRPPARGAAARTAHHVRPRTARTDRLLQRHRELLALPDRAASPAMPPPCLLNYFPKDWLLIVDESHVSIPQIGGMYKGDRARKEDPRRLRLPPAFAALDNRPLKFEEFEGVVNQVVYVSATPGKYELNTPPGRGRRTDHPPHRPVDPQVEVRPAGTRSTICCTRSAPPSSGPARAGDHPHQTHGRGPDRLLPRPRHRVRYLHADIDTLERTAILRDLRLGEFDVLVGINLLREGLDLPEVGLVGVLDADKEGFLRNQTSLIQTIGRAARNVEGRVILYADKWTDSMKAAIDETDRRRPFRRNTTPTHGITPRTVTKSITDLEHALGGIVKPVAGGKAAPLPVDLDVLADRGDLQKRIETTRAAMTKAAAKDMNFEKAAELRDQMRTLEKMLLALG
jgi:excinuclease ABC subunit B